MADDDKQSELMDQFLEKITPKLTETILASVTEKVEEQIGGVVKKNDELLDKLAKQKASDENLASLQSLARGARRQAEPGTSGQERPPALRP